MSFLKTIGKVLLSPLGAAAGLFNKPKKAEVVAPITATRNMAAERAAMTDSLAKRIGQKANRRTAYGGAEAATGAKTSLLGRT